VVATSSEMGRYRRASLARESTFEAWLDVEALRAVQISPCHGKKGMGEGKRRALGITFCRRGGMGAIDPVLVTLL